MKLLGFTSKLLFWGSVLGLIFTYFWKAPLPDLKDIDGRILLREPEQLSVVMQPFEKNIKEYTYTITPKYSYELYGLVVSEYDAESLFDYTHKEDPGNNKDLCVIWGEAITNGSYKEVKFESGEFTCFAKWDYVLSNSFPFSKVANNHMIAENEALKSIIKSAKRGDQVHFKGYLVDYSVKKNSQPLGQRYTSVIRTDTGNGACEVVYVTEFEIIKSANLLLKMYNDYSKYALGVSVVLYIIYFVRSKA